MLYTDKISMYGENNLAVKN